MDWMVSRATPRSVALETTLLCHGVPREGSVALARDLDCAIRGEGADPCVIGVLGGRAIAGMTDEEVARLVDLEAPKLNTSNLGMALGAPNRCGATTVSATMEIAAAAGVRVFATGGLGGVHKGALDVSADLAALTRFPVAVVCSGVKTVLDVEATREVLETLGVPVIGFDTDAFPAFYLRGSEASVDWRVDEVDALARTIRNELERTGRGVVIANPIPAEDELDRERLAGWIAEAEDAANTQGVRARDRTPFILGSLHDLSRGATLAANISLVLCNARLAAQLAKAIASD